MTLLAKNLEFLRMQKGLTQAQIEEKTGFGRTTWSNWENARSKPDVEEIFQIAKFFGVSVDDLFMKSLPDSPPKVVEGTSKKLAKSPPKSPPNSPPNVVSEPEMRYGNMVPKVVTVDTDGRDNVVLVPARARAGYLAGYEDPEFIQTLPSYRLPGLANTTHRMFEVTGQSMIPTFHESDIIAGRWVENLLEIKDDRVYVIVTRRDGIVVKRVINRVQREGKLILNSDNQRHPGEFPPIVLDPEDVLEVWYAVMYFSRQMRAPGEIYNRLIDLEARLTLIEEDRRKALPR